MCEKHLGVWQYGSEFPLQRVVVRENSLLKQETTNLSHTFVSKVRAKRHLAKWSCPMRTLRHPRPSSRRCKKEGVAIPLAAGFLFSLAFFGSTPAHGQHTVTLTVSDRAAVARTGEYVCFGVPIPRDWNLRDVSRLRLRDGTTPVPAQFEALARWGSHASNPSAPVKWVLAGYLASLGASTTRTLTLDDLGPGPAPGTPVSVNSSTPGKLFINTGAALFELNTGNNFNLLNQVTVGGQTLLIPLSATAAIDYDPIGLLSIVPGGTPDFTARATSVTLERNGPLCVAVRVRGSILDHSSRALLDFTARLHFVAGSPAVRLDFTVENNQPVIVGTEGQPANVHDQGSTNSVYIGEMRLKLRLKSTTATLRVITEQATQVSAPTSKVQLFQDSSGTNYWNVYLGLVGWEGNQRLAHPRLQSYCSYRGYKISGSDIATTVTGQQALGWMALFRTGTLQPRLMAAVRDFWQNFPKALEAFPDGTLAVNLFPKGVQFRHNFRVGEEKTHSVLLHFGLGAITAVQAESLARAFNNPLFGLATPDWYARSGALGEIPAVNLGRWPLYERYVRVAFEPNPDFNPAIDDPSFGNSTLRNAIERYNFYGWQDYGDVPLDYEAFGLNQAGQMNLKYWFLYGTLVQLCRSGDLRWLDLARPGAWHLADVDVLHIPDEGPQHWVHGGYFGHSQHDEPGNTNPNRNMNSPSVDLFFGVPDLLLAYHLTGERRFRDVALEELEGMLAEMQFSDFTNPVPYRERANLIFGFLEGYRHTGDSRWLNQMRTVVGATADLSNKQGWLTSPTTYRRDEDRLSSFQFGQTLWACGKYLDFCAEYGLTDNLGMAGAFAAYGNFILNHFMTEYLPGRAASRDSYWFFDPGYETYLEINNWALVMADALAYAHKFTGQQRFLDAAVKFYATGTIDPQWQDDPPVYIDTKGLVNSCNWGLVYMSRQARPTGAGFWMFY